VLVTDKALLYAGATICATELMCFAHFARSSFITIGFVNTITTVHMTIAPARYWKAWWCVQWAENLYKQRKKCDGIYLSLQTFTKSMSSHFQLRHSFQFLWSLCNNIFLLSKPVNAAFPHNLNYRTNDDLRHNNNFLQILEIHGKRTNNIEIRYCRCRY
jgi:hypothetical protein